MAANRVNKRPSMFEVAKLAGVSHQTVSRVINHSPDVSEVTRAKVQAAIDRLGYRPSNSARALASQRSRTIGLIAGGLRFFGPSSAISSIETMARAHELFMSVMLVHEAFCSQKDFETLCDTFDEQNVDAFIFLTPTDAMFSAACHAPVQQPRVLITSTHGAVDIRTVIAAIRPADQRKVALVGIDQAIKLWATQYLAPVEAITDIPHVVELRFVLNQGMAFSLLSGKQLFLILATSAALLLVAYLLFFRSRGKLLQQIAFILVLAGGSGNLIDRVLNGEVVDYINPLFIDFAVFNFADILVCVGVALWVLVILLEEVEDKPSKEQ